MAVAYRILVSAPVPFWVYLGWNWVGLGCGWILRIVVGDYGLTIIVRVTHHKLETLSSIVREPECVVREPECIVR